MHWLIFGAEEVFMLRFHFFLLVPTLLFTCLIIRGLAHLKIVIFRVSEILLIIHWPLSDCWLTVRTPSPILESVTNKIRIVDGLRGETIDRSLLLGLHLDRILVIAIRRTSIEGHRLI
jgi:hypothetical protein